MDDAESQQSPKFGAVASAETERPINVSVLAESAAEAGPDQQNCDVIARCTNAESSAEAGPAQSKSNDGQDGRCQKPPTVERLEEVDDNRRICSYVSIVAVGPKRFDVNINNEAHPASGFMLRDGSAETICTRAAAGMGLGPAEVGHASHRSSPGGPSSSSAEPAEVGSSPASAADMCDTISRALTN